MYFAFLNYILFFSKEFHLIIIFAQFDSIILHR